MKLQRSRLAIRNIEIINYACFPLSVSTRRYFRQNRAYVLRFKASLTPRLVKDSHILCYIRGLTTKHVEHLEPNHDRTIGSPRRGRGEQPFRIMRRLDVNGRVSAYITWFLFFPST